MNDEKFKIKRKIVVVGNVSGITLSQDILNHLDAKQGDDIYIQPENGKHGNFITVWKKNND